MPIERSGTTGLAEPASALGAHKRRGEAGGCCGSTGTGRAGEQPRVSHRRAVLTPQHQLRIIGSATQLLNDGVLAD
jgi:hypothetical protein